MQNEKEKDRNNDPAWKFGENAASAKVGRRLWTGIHHAYVSYRKSILSAIFCDCHKVLSADLLVIDLFWGRGTQKAGTAVADLYCRPQEKRGGNTRK